MPLQCPNCRSINKDTAAFCNDCGTRLVIPSNQTTSSVAGSKPESLPEDVGWVSVAQPPASLPPTSSTPFYASVRPPRVQPGLPRHPHPWRWLIVFVFVSAVLGIAWIAMDHYTTEDILGGAFLFGLGSLALGSPIAWWKSRASTSTGIVTHLREWSPQQQSKPQDKQVFQNWLFDLRLIDKKGNTLMDRKGFLYPIIEVEFRADKVHGPPIEEGSRVVLKGKWHKARFRAVNIWNCSPAMDTPVLGAGTAYWGQVLDLQLTSAPDMRYPGQRSLQVLSFRLQPTDSSFRLLRDGQGNLFPPLPVEVRAQSIGGTPPKDGDRVRVCGQEVQGIIYTREVYNHSTSGAPLVVKEWAGIS